MAGAGAGAAGGVCAAGAVGVPLASGAAASGFLFLSEYRVLSVATVLAFFFFAAVSPFKPSGVDWACRSATSAASGAGGASLLAGVPFAFGVFGVLARALKRVFCVGLSSVSSGFTGSAAALAAVAPDPAPASSVALEGAFGNVFVGACP